MWLQKGRGVANEWLWTCRLVSIGSIGSHFEIRGVGGYPKGSSGKTRGWGDTLELCGEYRGDFINFPPKTQ